MFNLDAMAKAAGVAVKAHVRRAPASAAGRMKKSNLRTIGLAAGEIAPHVDIMKHLSGAVGKGADELAHYYKNMHLTPSAMQGQAQLAHAAAARPAAAAPAAALAVKKTPTQAFSQKAVMAHAANTAPAQVIQGAVKGTGPQAMGTSALLDQLSRTSFDKLSMMLAIHKLANFNPPNSLTPKHVTDALEKLRQSTAAKRATQAATHAVQQARYDARQMGAAVGSSR